MPILTIDQIRFAETEKGNIVTLFDCDTNTNLKKNYNLSFFFFFYNFNKFDKYLIINKKNDFNTNLYSYKFI